MSEQVLERAVLRPKRDEDDLIKEPDSFGPDFEVLERHIREAAANHFKYADNLGCGNPRTYDPDGRYNCGRCNQYEDGSCLLVDVKKVDDEAGSCGDWENQFAGDPETLLKEKSVDAAGYGIAANGKGFGCFRCPYGHPTEADSLGRNWWCGKFGARTLQSACCVLNGATLVGEK